MTGTGSSVGGWRGTARGWQTTITMLGASVGMGVLALILAAVVRRSTATVVEAVAITGIVLLGFGILRCLGDALAAGLIVVSITGHAVNVRPVVLPFAGSRITTSQIRAAEAISSVARPWASWGWWLPAAQSPDIVLRTGPALVLELTSGRRITISVDQPEDAAHLLSRMRTGELARNAG